MNDILKEYKEHAVIMDQYMKGAQDLLPTHLRAYRGMKNAVIGLSAKVTEYEDEINRLRALEYTVERAIKTVQADRDYNGEVG